MTEEEIKDVHSGTLILDESCVLCFDFEDGISNGKVNDISGKENHAEVHGDLKILLVDNEEVDIPPAK